MEPFCVRASVQPSGGRWELLGRHWEGGDSPCGVGAAGCHTSPSHLMTPVHPGTHGEDPEGMFSCMPWARISQGTVIK